MIKAWEEKFILDPTCASRSIWFNKNHPNTLYTDIRREESGFITNRPNFTIIPDVIADFKDMSFLKDKKFKLIVWDPPHLRNLDEKSWILKKYGGLGPQWKEDLREGFNELWNLLENFGVLIFKWSVSHDCRPNRDVSVKDVLALFHEAPLFGHTTGKSGNTMWMCFMKIPEIKK